MFVRFFIFVFIYICASSQRNKSTLNFTTSPRWKGPRRLSESSWICRQICCKLTAVSVLYPSWFFLNFSALRSINKLSVRANQWIEPGILGPKVMRILLLNHLYSIYKYLLMYEIKVQARLKIQSIKLTKSNARCTRALASNRKYSTKRHSLVS